MFIRIATALLASTLNVAWPMCRAGQNAVLVESDTVARFLERIGSAGEALESLVDRLANRWGIDIANQMIERAYGR
jgi:hypothetical protein